MVYLCCAGDGSHYVGSCRDDRFETRMAEHRRTPTSIFKRWAALGIAWRVARTWKRRGQDTKEAIKAYKKHRAFCPSAGCSGRKARSTRGLKFHHGAYWIARATMHGKGLSYRTINRGKRLRAKGLSAPNRRWVPRESAPVRVAVAQRQAVPAAFVAAWANGEPAF